MPLSPCEITLLTELVWRHGFGEVVVNLSAIAARKAHELEQEVLDPRRYADIIGEYVWIAEILGRCVDELDQ